MRSWTVVALALTAACSATERGTAPILTPGAPATVFRDVRLFDGERHIPRATVVVEGSKILLAGAGVEVPAGPGVRVIDGAGKTLLPGFIDAHTHGPKPDSLAEALALGVTTELDMFSDPRAVARAKRAISAENAPTLADLFSAGIGATAPGGHGTGYGTAIPTVDRPDAARAFIDARFAEGSDYAKLIVDDGSAYGVKIPTLDAPTLKALVDATHARGKIAVAHIGSLGNARDALEAGADGLAHLFVAPAPDPGFGAFVAAHRAFVVPTLAVLWGMCDGRRGAKTAADPRLVAHLLPDDRKNLAAVVSHRGKRPSCDVPKAAIAQLRAARVPILAGTDAPNEGTAHGASLHEELVLLVKAGLTPLEALVAATSAPATAFRLADRGRVEPGLRADLVLVNGDPTRDITDTRNLAGVWKAGVAVDREAHAAAVAAAVADAQKRLENGLVSDFDSGDAPAARFGAGWAPSTDTAAGGKSTVTLSIRKGGAHGSAGALSIQGKVDAPELPYAWAGAMFHPGDQPRAPADLSSKRKIHFWARGDVHTYRLLFFAKRSGPQPFGTNFKVTGAWQEYELTLSNLGGTLDDVTAILFAGGPWQGAFTLEIDDVRFE